ncbi:Uncharacterized protein Fot_53064 [Forsythia ovata]|uniref:Uncharacterized protein n=1 Tax=Forsythia ovata TaxID=205694 RepID=A0ABD1PHL5_9LAMI
MVFLLCCLLPVVDEWIRFEAGVSSEGRWSVVRDGSDSKPGYILKVYIHVAFPRKLCGEVMDILQNRGVSATLTQFAVIYDARAKTGVRRTKIIDTVAKSCRVPVEWVE